MNKTDLVIYLVIGDWILILAGFTLVLLPIILDFLVYGFLFACLRVGGFKIKLFVCFEDIYENCGIDEIAKGDIVFARVVLEIKILSVLV